MSTRGFKSWCENVAIRQRRELNLRPVDPLDPWLLAEHLGVMVWTADRVPGLATGHLRTLQREGRNHWSAVTLTVGSKDLIILNPTHSGGRPASDLMHELAHLLMGHRPARVYVSEDGLLMLDTYDRAQEEEARWLAGCLLVPRGALVFIRRQNMDLAAAAEKYGVSLDMLRYRLNVTGVDRQFSRAWKGVGHPRK